MTFLNNKKADIIDPVFDLFPQDGYRDSKDYFYNFLGGRVRKSMLPKLGDGSNKDKPFWNATLQTNKSPYYACSEDYFEWLDLFASISEAEDSYSFIKLGSDTGRWETFAALANRSLKKLPCRLVSVESKKVRYKRDIKRVASDNGVDKFEEVAHKIYPKKVSKSTSKDSVSLKDVLSNFDKVDLIDCDIQGHEEYIFHHAKKQLCNKVKRIHIGTHSKKIDKVLYDLFKDMGWINVFNFECFGMSDLPQGRIYFQDGIQTWKNPNL